MRISLTLGFMLVLLEFSVFCWAIWVCMKICKITYLMTFLFPFEGPRFQNRLSIFVWFFDLGHDSVTDTDSRIETREAIPYFVLFFLVKFLEFDGVSYFSSFADFHTFF